MPRDDVPLMSEQIKTQLRRQIGRRWAVGETLPSIRDLARQMDAGRSNVHRAVQQLVDEGLLASRVGRGTVVLRNPAVVDPDAPPAPAPAPAMPLAGRHVLLLRAPDLFQLSAADPVVDELSARGCRVTCCALLHEDLDTVLKTHRGVHGIVYVDPPADAPIRLRSETALVLINAARHVRIEGPADYDTVESDSYQGGRLAGAYARRIGSRSVCFLAVHPKHLQREMDPISAERLRGFEAGFGARIADELQLVSNRYNVQEGMRAADVAAQIGPRPDTVFAPSDDLAFGFAQRAAELGMTLGEDMQLIGFDGQRRGRHLPGGALTTVDVPMADIGRAAAAMMADRLLSPQTPSRTTRFACRLFAGATTRTPRPAAARANA